MAEAVPGPPTLKNAPWEKSAARHMGEVKLARRMAPLEVWRALEVAGG